MAHVAWPHLLPLAARLRGALAALDHGAPTVLLNNQARRVAKRFDQLSFHDGLDLNLEFRDEDDSETSPLDAFLNELHQGLLAYNDARAPAAVKKLLLGYRGVFGSGICAQCAQRRGQSTGCRWTEASQDGDQQALAQGDCIELVQELFKLSNRIAHDAYAASLGASPPQTVSFSTGFRKVKDSHLNLSIHGEVTEARGSVLLRQVHAGFYVEGFGIHDYLSLLPVLFHECFVHAYCGVNVVGGKANVSKPFHDGWMDCIATWVLIDKLRSATPLAVPLRVHRHRDAFSKQAVELRQKRYSQELLDSAPDAEDWGYGAEALGALEWLARKVLEARGEVPIEPTLRLLLVNLSVALNVSNISHSDRASLVEVLFTRYAQGSDEERGMALSESPQVLDYIDGYVDSRDVSRFVKQVVAIR